MTTNSNLDGHLSEDTEIKGTLRFEGSVRIDGKFEGKISSPATLILGPKARVRADVQVAELAVHGVLRGQVQATQRVTIHATGRVDAELKTQRLVIEEGAYYQGRCDMPQRDGSAPKPGSAPAAGKAASASPPNAG